MNKQNKVGLLALSLALTASALGQETKVKMSNLPAAVQATVTEQSKGATVRGLAKEVEKGKTFYEAELLVGDRHKDVLIDASGKVVEVEEQVELNTLPAPVKAEIERQAGKRQIAIIESVTKNGALVYYEAHIKTGIRTKEVKVAPDGKVVK